MRIHVVIPDEVLEEIDHLVGPRGRSKFLTDAAKAQLKRNDFLRIAIELGGSLKDAHIPGWETSESAAEWVHRLRYHPDEPVVPPADEAPEHVS
jgi:hypothetical protein